MTETNHTSRKASWLRRTANALSISRIATVPVVGAEIIQGEYRSWWLVGGFALLAATDKLDGTLARHASQLDPAAPNTHGAKLDQMADKVFVNGTLGSLALSEAVQGNHVLSGIYAVNLAAWTVRDWWVTRIRSRAEEYDVPTNAQWPGKVKATVQMAALSMAVSPLAGIGEAQPLTVGETITATAVTAGTALATASGIMLGRNLNNAMQQAQQPLP